MSTQEKKPPSSAWYRSSAEPHRWKEEEVLTEARLGRVVCLPGAAVPCPCPRLLPSAAKPVQKWLQGHVDHAEFAPEASGWAVPRGHREVPRWPGSRSRLAERGCVRNAHALKRSLIIRDQTRQSRGGHARARLPTNPRLPEAGSGHRPAEAWVPAAGRVTGMLPEPPSRPPPVLRLVDGPCVPQSSPHLVARWSKQPVRGALCKYFPSLSWRWRQRDEELL